eukprot:scaffold11371_cov112-Isochrysis_galbana.AAC.6
MGKGSVRAEVGRQARGVPCPAESPLVSATERRADMTARQWKTGTASQPDRHHRTKPQTNDALHTHTHARPRLQQQHRRHIYRYCTTTEP